MAWGQGPSNRAPAPAPRATPPPPPREERPPQGDRGPKIKYENIGGIWAWPRDDGGTNYSGYFRQEDGKEIAIKLFVNKNTRGTRNAPAFDVCINQDKPYYTPKTPRPARQG